MKRLILISLSLIVAITFVGCGKPDKKDYVGAWKCVAIISQDQSYPEDFDSAAREAKKVDADVEKNYPDEAGLFLNYLSLDEDQKGAFFLLNDAHKGSWKLADDSILFFQDDAPDFYREFKIDFKNNRLIYEIENGSKFIYEKVKKK